jgi:hypothetical protein
MCAFALLLHPAIRQQVIEGIENFRNNFRGGPPSPMHPSPAGDVVHLRKPGKKFGTVRLQCRNSLTLLDLHTTFRAISRKRR